ncbi:hypothetical protein ACPV5O_20915 [Vibrio maritimus]|uniref:hypothetical protein n=1 Tax=Vibrio maritimus TaxID=990268 RepID=UPI004068AE3C
MNTGLKLLAMAASLSIVGCASKPYNAGQYAIENQRLASESSLEAVEPDEQFSNAMKIMYDYTQVEIDRANNLDQPFVRGSSAAKDAISAGGTAALLASGASLLDASSFLLGSSYKKDVSSLYNNNRILRFVEVSESTTPVELEKLIADHQKELAKLIATSYGKVDVDYTFIDETKFSPEIEKAWYKSAYHVIPRDRADSNRNFSKLCKQSTSEVESFITRLNAIYDVNCQSQVLRHLQFVVNDDLQPVAAFNGRKVPNYAVISAILPDDFPMSALSSTYPYDYAFQPAFAWFYSPSKFARTYGEKDLKQEFEAGNVVFMPTLTALQTSTNVPFSYQSK